MSTTIESAEGKASLRELIAPVRGRVRLGCVLSGLGAALGVLPAMAIAEIARALLSEPTDSALVWRWTLAGVVTAALATAAALAASQVCHFADADFRYLTRRRVVEHLTSLPLGWFTGRGSGEVKRTVSDDVKGMHTLVAHTYVDATAAIVGPLVTCGYLFWRDWLLTLVLLAFIIGALAVTFPRMNVAYQDNMDAWEDAQQRIASGAVELIDGIEVVKTYGTSAGVFRRFTESVMHLSQVAVRWMSAIGGPNILLTNLFSAAGLILWITATGTALIALGWSDAATLVAFLTVGVGLPAGFMNMIQLGYVTREAQASAAHVREVLETPGLPVPQGPARPEGARVEFDAVGFAYDDGTTALDEVSAVFEPGTVSAIVGPSGSGKSTLARLIPRFWDATSGHVLFGGVDLRDIDPQVLLGTVGFVFQETFLLRDTVSANLRLGRPDAGDEQLERAARAARIHDRITALPDGYHTVLGDDGAVLSGGERQRLAIARTILQDAPVVVLDEATAHADPESEHEVQQALSALAAGKTVIVIAHRLHTIRHADQIVVLDGGRVAERGTHEELLAHEGLYERLWATQNLDSKELR